MPNRQELRQKLKELRAGDRAPHAGDAEEAQRNNDEHAVRPERAMQLSDRDLQKMAEQARAGRPRGPHGRRAAARWRELEKMLDQLRNARADARQATASKPSSKRQRGKRQQMGVVQD